MRDPDFLDGMLLGAILLVVVFVIMWIGFGGFLPIHPILVPVLCGLPAIAAIAIGYNALRWAIGEAIRPHDTRRYWLPGEHPWMDATPPTYCHACGTKLEFTSRWRRGYCPTCRAYR